MEIQQKVSFEENFAMLERVVESLEKGDLTLDEAIGLFEKGMLLAKVCNDQLEAAELRIAKVRAVPNGGDSGDVD